MKNTRIEWADNTINFYMGCTKISPGCANCYMFTLLNRYGTYDPSILNHMSFDNVEKNLKTWKPSRIFVNSMSDTFHEKLSFKEIDEMFYIMNKYPQHQYLILTKRIWRAVDYFRDRPPKENFWIGTSVENGDYHWINRIYLLKLIDAKIRFVSFEPLIGPITDVDLKNIQWAIIGGESGPKARPIREEWVQRLLEVCRRDNVAFFFKQWGGFTSKSGGRLLNGKTYDEYPVLEVTA